MTQEDSDLLAKLKTLALRTGDGEYALELRYAIGIDAWSIVETYGSEIIKTHYEGSDRKSFLELLNKGNV